MSDRLLHCPEHGLQPHRLRPSPEAGPWWRCSVCGWPSVHEEDLAEVRRQAEAETVAAIVAWHRSEADHCEAERRVEETLSGGLVMVSTFEVRRDQHIQAADAIERGDHRTTEEGQG